MKKMIAKVVVLVLVLAAVGSIGFIFGSSSADAKSTDIFLKPNKSVCNYNDEDELMAVEYIDTDTGVHYFVTVDSSKRGSSITFMCPRYDKKGNVMVTKVK